MVKHALKSYSVNSARFVRHVWPFFIFMYERVNMQRPLNHRIHLSFHKVDQKVPEKMTICCDHECFISHLAASRLTLGPWKALTIDVHLRLTPNAHPSASVRFQSETLKFQENTRPPCVTITKSAQLLSKESSFNGTPPLWRFRLDVTSNLVRSVLEVRISDNFRQWSRLENIAQNIESSPNYQVRKYFGKARFLGL